ncbi:uncharacterized protein LAESUDRAFT_763205 [Laetiporus sulphureus 93-53]|uniref:Uncharacterized protein n=1 Tax=Laetiporus sulphureus 93-53 TaxID=1314785 RepID=A0A165C2X1_9APHY|nr:uncharacterized protein LAESUDRAFT_763205 [Laetiporus sulphureus 93-53]KZT02104.1 hypothetical protein LAESUDRAFT_763205 [Laetiporus sulphureus 93-53]
MENVWRDATAHSRKLSHAGDSPAHVLAKETARNHGLGKRIVIAMVMITALCHAPQSKTTNSRMATRAQGPIQPERHAVEHERWPPVLAVSRSAPRQLQFHVANTSPASRYAPAIHTSHEGDGILDGNGAIECTDRPTLPVHRVESRSTLRSVCIGVERTQRKERSPSSIAMLWPRRTVWSRNKAARSNPSVDMYTRRTEQRVVCSPFEMSPSTPCPSPRITVHVTVRVRQRRAHAAQGTLSVFDRDGVAPTRERLDETVVLFERASTARARASWMARNGRQGIRMGEAAAGERIVGDGGFGAKSG